MRHFKRKHLTLEEVLSQRQNQATPEAVECRTPSPRPISSPMILAVPEQTFRKVWEYHTASFENGIWIVTEPELHCYRRKEESFTTKDMHKLYNQLMGATDLFKLGNPQEAG